jgi:hypothetical protein
VRLKVKSTNKNNPLKGDVYFYLHPNVPENACACTRRWQKRVETIVSAYGAFTVGAVADNGQTKLELDLATLPDAPPEFRKR